MSNKTPLGLKVGEKVFALLVVIVGLTMTYYTYVNLSTAGSIGSFFIYAGFCLIVLGILFFVVKIEDAKPEN